MTPTINGIWGSYLYYTRRPTDNLGIRKMVDTSNTSNTQKTEAKPRKMAAPFEKMAAPRKKMAPLFFQTAPPFRRTAPLCVKTLPRLMKMAVKETKKASLKPADEKPPCILRILVTGRWLMAFAVVFFYGTWYLVDCFCDYVKSSMPRKVQEVEYCCRAWKGCTGCIGCK